MASITMKNTIRHFRTITRHRRYVRRHCRRCGIGFQGMFHDLSKYSRTEFWAGVRYYQGTRSPNDSEREEMGYSLAWMHHKGRNKHHFDYWVDFDPKTHLPTPVEMPVRYVAEMFCDRMAASKIYNGKSYTDGDSLAYFMRGKNKRVINQNTSDLLEDWLTVLANDGEKAAFRQVRRAVRTDRKKQRRHKAEVKRQQKHNDIKKQPKAAKRSGDENTVSNDKAA